MNDRFKFRIPMFTDKGSFIEFQYIELGDEIECTLCGYNGEFEQCTGLKDKNGKLIYEGDIVKFNYDTDEIIAVVSWDDNEGQVGYYLNTTDYFKDKYVTDYDFYKNDYEVLGNIYENKELLESEG